MEPPSKITCSTSLKITDALQTKSVAAQVGGELSVFLHLN